MGLADNPALWFLPFAVIIGIWVAWSDMATMKIPNRAVLALLVVFVVIGAVALPFDAYWPRFLHFAIVLAISFVLSLAGVMGAGDAKFAAAMAPFIVASDFTVVLILFGVCVLFGFLTHRAARMVPAIRRATPGWESWERMREFPMGYPLALTLVIYLALIAF